MLGRCGRYDVQITVTDDLDSKKLFVPATRRDILHPKKYVTVVIIAPGQEGVLTSFFFLEEVHHGEDGKETNQNDGCCEGRNIHSPRQRQGDCFGGGDSIGV
jgi:hypothetical protein